MSTPDFSKLFGSSASSTQDWSDSNYLTGWGYLGQELPPYQLFDFLQKQNDTKMKWLYDNLVSNTAVTWDGNNFSCPALGINGLMAQNGYISFGKLFGGLILQWG
uniref:hypothetical protein n=1 Tax=Pectinatus frisingensis TaxID=865 RepID=UPI0018C7768B